jgi:TRAP-type C4-dicarboxylate transport system substrate-binding protein
MKPFVLGAALAVAVALAPAAAESAKKPKPKVQLKIATIAPEGSTWMNLMREMDERVRAETDNEVGFKFYAGGVQGDERLVLRKMRSGQLHGGGFTGNGLGVIAPSVRVLESPFLFLSEEEIDAVYAELGTEFEAAIEASGHVLLGWAEVGFVHLFTKQPVRGMDDLKDIKMWLWEGDPLASAFFEEAKIAPVSLAITDVYTSLQTGLVDGVYSSPYAAVVLQWHALVGAMSEVPITHAVGAVVVTERSWKKVSPESQEKVRVIADDVFKRLKASSRAENHDAVDDIRAAGLEIVRVPDAELEVFREIGARAAARSAGELYSAELLERVQSLVAAHRETGPAAGE